MIQREWMDVNVLWFPTGVDEYGQKRQGEPTVQTVEMVCKIFSQLNIADPRYVDIDVVGLTNDHTITDKNEVVINENDRGIPTGTYTVKYVIPSDRLYQVLLKKKCHSAS